MTHQPKYRLVQDEAELGKLAKAMLDAELPVGFDVETGYDGPDREKASLDPFQNFICGFSFTNSTDWAVYVPIQHEFAIQIDPEVAMSIMKPLLESGLCVAHNGKFERRCLSRYGIDLKLRSDTILEAFALGEDKFLGLKEQTELHLGYKQIEIKELLPNVRGKKLSTMRFNVLDPEDPRVLQYACDDAWTCLAHHLRNYPKVKDNFIYKLEMACLDTLIDMEEWGVRIDWDFIRKFEQPLRTFMDAYYQEILADLSAMTGEPINININSSAQLGDVLYNKLGMSTRRRTKAGKPSTDAVAMEGLSKKYPVVKKILEWREIQAFLKRYTEKWPNEFSYYQDGRAHPNYKQTDVETGRFAANDPAVHQMPKRKHWKLTDGRELEIRFRHCIIPADGYYLLDYDYQQVELRVMAGEAQEPAMLQAFEDGIDIHKRTASVMLVKPLDSVEEEDRDIGKTLNFALLYGMGVASLSDRLAVSKERAAELDQAYFDTFPSIRSWADRMKEEGERRGYSLTKFGRKMTIHELKSSYPNEYSKGLRKCINGPVQGGAADYMKVAMVRVTKVLKDKGWWGDKVRIVINLHDELLFEVHESIQPDEAIAAIQPAVQFPVEGWPRIDIDWDVGYRWGALLQYTPGILCQDGEITFPAGPPHEGERTAGSVSPAEREEYGAPASAAAAVENGGTDSIPHTGCAITVTLQQMPSQDDFKNFLHLLSKHPGPNAVTLVTPEGELVLDATTSLTEKEQADISIALNGADVHRDEDTVDAEELTQGIQL